MMMATEWKLGKTGTSCSSCGKAFGAHDVAISVLVEDTGSELRRAEYCDGCLPPSGTSVHSRWKGRRGPIEKSKRLNLDHVRELFSRAAASTSQMDQEVAFFLGLLLVRKRRLRLKETTRVDGRETLHLEAPTGEGPFAIVNPVLTPERLEVLDRELRDLLVLS